MKLYIFWMWPRIDNKLSLLSRISLSLSLQATAITTGLGQRQLAAMAAPQQQEKDLPAAATDGLEPVVYQRSIPRKVRIELERVCDAQDLEAKINFNLLQIRVLEAN